MPAVCGIIFWSNKLTMDQILITLWWGSKRKQAENGSSPCDFTVYKTKTGETVVSAPGAI